MSKRVKNGITEISYNKLYNDRGKMFEMYFGKRSIYFEIHYIGNTDDWVSYSCVNDVLFYQNEKTNDVRVTPVFKSLINFEGSRLFWWSPENRFINENEIPDKVRSILKYFDKKAKKIYMI